MKQKISIAVIVSLIFIMGVGAFVLSEHRIYEKNRVYKIGDRGPAGGWIFYDKGNNSNGWRYLEAAPEDQDEWIGWGYFKVSVPGAQGTAIGTGKSNTQSIMDVHREQKFAAEKCTEYRGGGKSDWFLPSKDELNLIYLNLYKAGIGGLSGEYYWSSSEFSPNRAWHQVFCLGTQFYWKKGYQTRVRAVRAF